MTNNSASLLRLPNSVLLVSLLGGVTNCGSGGGDPPPIEPEPNLSPSASVEVPSDIVVGEPVTFLASASDPNSDAVNQLDRLAVSYGDGSADTVSVSGRSASVDFVHTYALPGSQRVRVTAIDRGGLTGSASGTASVDALVDVSFDVVSANSSMIPSERGSVRDLSYEVLDEDGVVLASGVSDDGFVVSVPESSRLRADLSAPGYLPGVVALRAGDVWTANHPDSLGSFPASAGSVRALMVEDEGIVANEAYSDVAGLLRWYGNWSGAQDSNVGWNSNPRMWVNNSNMSASDSISVAHGIDIMRQCAQASEFSGLDDIGQVVYSSRDPTEQERNNNTIWIKKRPEQPATASSSHDHAVGIPPSLQNPDLHTGLYFFKIDSPDGQGPLADQVSVLGIKNSQGDENLLISTDGSDLARDGEIACSVVNNFPLRYQFPSDDELASVSTSSSTSYVGR